MATTIFCDEAGFDGNNLLNADQPHFVYAAVEVDEELASSITGEARSIFKLKSPEIHAARLLRRDSGKSAIAWLLDRLSGRFTITCFHKRYALACKFFEYMIEPIISDSSLYFYQHGFHKFIANGIYLAALCEPRAAARTLSDFQSLMRNRDSTELTELIHELFRIAEGKDDFLCSVATILLCNQPSIHGELRMVHASSEGSGIAQWILDLSVTALRSLLAQASGAEMRPLVVTCDHSKPLLSGADFINIMVDREDCRTIEFDKLERQLTFRLVEDVRFACSKTSCGIQLADVAASSASYALRYPSDRFSLEWFEKHAEAMHENVFPDPAELDLEDFRVVKNTMILQQLVSRSVENLSLTENITELDFLATQASLLFVEALRGEPS